MERLVYCGITNEPAVNPILCRSTGFIFDRDTIKVYLEKNGNRCPKTGAEVTYPRDFVEIQALEGPSLNKNSTIPRQEKLEKVGKNYLEMVEEARTYKKTIQVLKDKLISSLKMQKSGLSLIKQLKKERDDARRMLMETDYELREQGVERVRQLDDLEILFDEISKSALRLNTVRKQMAKVYKNETSNFLKDFKEREAKDIAFEFSDFDPSRFEILAHPFNLDAYLVSDKTQTVAFDFENLRAKKVFDVSFKRCDQILASSHITPDEEEKLGYILALNDGNLQTGILDISDGKGEIHSTRNLGTKFLSLEEHPVEKLLVGLDEFRTVSIYDLSKEVISFTSTIEDDLQLTSLGVHPDGKLLALAGSNSNLHFFDIVSNQVVLTLESASVSLHLLHTFYRGK